MQPRSKFSVGVLIPVNHSSGLLAVLTYLMPMTYLVDLARAVFYWGTAQFSHIVVYNPALDLLVTAVFFAIFSSVGTIFFTRVSQQR